MNMNISWLPVPLYWGCLMPRTWGQQEGKSAAVVTLDIDVGEHPLLEKWPLHGARGCRFCRISSDVCALLGGLAISKRVGLFSPPLSQSVQKPPCPSHTCSTSCLCCSQDSEAHGIGSGVSQTLTGFLWFQFLFCFVFCFGLLLTHILVIPRLWDGFHILQRRGNEDGAFPLSWQHDQGCKNIHRGTWPCTCREWLLLFLI